MDGWDISIYVCVCVGVSPHALRYRCAKRETSAYYFITLCSRPSLFQRDTNSEAGYNWDERHADTQGHARTHTLMKTELLEEFQ